VFDVQKPVIVTSPTVVHPSFCLSEQNDLVISATKLGIPALFWKRRIGFKAFLTNDFFYFWPLLEYEDCK
jgi:hypothetical protein